MQRVLCALGVVSLMELSFTSHRGYSTLGLLHLSFFKQVEHQIMTRLSNKLNGQEIANLLWSFATLNAQPEPALVDVLSTHVHRICSGNNGSPDEASIAKIFNRQELANVAWSCAVLGRYPEKMMQTLYQGLFGSTNDPQAMNRVHGDAGLEKSSLMTMYYVQYAAEVEAPELNLSLPNGFPNGWHEGSSSSSDIEDDQTSSSMLQLTISKLQKDVSRSLTNIGFENSMEYVIDAPTNQQAGEELPENPDEFLSIDIANVNKRLGIEVDGPGHFVRLIDQNNKSNRKSSADDADQFADKGDNRVNGPTLLKHRLLTALGWNIIHIPYWEYQYLEDDKREEYCRSIMDRHCSSWDE